MVQHSLNDEFPLLHTNESFHYNIQELVLNQLLFSIHLHLIVPLLLTLFWLLLMGFLHRGLIYRLEFLMYELQWLYDIDELIKSFLHEQQVLLLLHYVKQYLSFIVYHLEEILHGVQL